MPIPETPIAQFAEYDRGFLRASARWLRDIEIQRLTLTPEFSEESQERWFASLAGRGDYRVWGVLVDNIPIGAVGLKNIDPVRSEAEYWGYIGEKAFWGRGIGRQMVQFILGHSRSSGLRKVYLRVSGDNTRALGLYRKAGFEIASEAGGIITMQRTIE
jgi:RimJ/RimL family protein N-acetyltransferase